MKKNAIAAKTPEQIRSWLRSTRSKLDEFPFYQGGEPGLIKQRWEDYDKHICIVFVGSYHVMGVNMAVPLVTQMMKDLYGKDIYIGRTFLPCPADLQRFQDDGIPLFDVDSKHAIGDFDVVGFSVSYVPYMPLVARMLRMSGIPLETQERGLDNWEWPLIIGSGYAYHAFEMIAPAIDLVLGGDGEYTVPKFLKEFLRAKAEGVSKEEFVYRLNRDYRGFYVPSFYKWEFLEDGPNRGEIKAITPVKPGLPKEVKVGYQMDWTNKFMYRKPIVHFDPNPMGLGQLQVSKGCGGRCSFCQETYTDGPYREMHWETALSVLRDQFRYSGAVDVAPTAFTFGQYTHRKRLIKELYEKVTDKVNLVSERADDFNDENMASLAGFAGDRTISVGIEGHSVRMRQRVNKMISEEDILHFFEYCFRAGYTKIKMYMISNLPDEMDEDREEFVTLCRKLVDLREKMGVTTQIQASWTQIVYMASTPMQWMECGFSRTARTLNKVWPSLREMGVKLRFGPNGAPADAYLHQAMQFTGRNYWPVWRDLVLIDGYTLGSSSSIKPGMEKYFEERAAALGLPSYALMFREKPKEYLFPHEVWNTGVKRDYLWRMGEKYHKAAESNVCQDVCSACSACTSEKSDFGSKLEYVKSYYHDTMSQFKQVQDNDVDTEKMIPIAQKGGVQRLRLKVQMPSDKGLIVTDFWRTLLRRTMHLSGVPFDKYSIACASAVKRDVLNIAGVDYFDIKLLNKMSVKEVAALIPKLQSELKYMRILDWRLHSIAESDVHRAAWGILYRMPLQTDYSHAVSKVNEVLAMRPLGEIQQDMDRNAKRDFLLKNKLAVSIEYSDFVHGTTRKLVDVRAHLVDMWVTQEKKFPCLWAICRGDAVPQHYLRAMFDMSFSEAGRLMARRYEVLRAPVASVAHGLDSLECVDCGRAFNTSLFGRALRSGDSCLKCTSTRRSKEARMPEQTVYRMIGRSAEEPGAADFL